MVDDNSTGSAWIFDADPRIRIRRTLHIGRGGNALKIVFFVCFYFEIFFGLQTDYPSSINNLLLSYHKIRYCLPFMYHYGSTSFSDPVFLS